MKVTLNRENFIVTDNEFCQILNPNYQNLYLVPELGSLEREIGLINELVDELGGDKNIFISIGLTHGGYLPIKITSNFHQKIVISSDEIQINNFNQNKEIHDCKNIMVSQNYDNISFSDESLIIIKLESNNSIETTKYLSHTNTIILSYLQMQMDKFYNYQLEGTNLWIHVASEINGLFRKKFGYYLKNDSNVLNYDNLINLCIMVKNAGDGFRSILENNLPYVDKWTFLDTGSTDNTLEIIKDVMKNKKGKLYQEPFINFRDSRNRCLDLAGESCKFNIMLDDTYVLKGNVREFLHLIRSDQRGDSYNVMINSDNLLYGSNRITKSDRKLRYIYKIHEIIQIDDNFIVQIPEDEICIKDINNQYMIERTRKRKEHDLELLFEEIRENPDVPRHLYYIANTYAGLEKWNDAFEYYQKRIAHSVEGFRDEVTDSYFQSAMIAENHLGWKWDKCEKIYLKCFNYDETRSDALFMIGHYYYKIGMNHRAFPYFKKGFKLGTPIHNTSDLRPMIYNNYLPKLLTELCYEFGYYKLGQKAAEKYLKHNPHDDTIKSYFEIFCLLNQDKSESYIRNIPNKKILCFVADGGYKNWSGSSILAEGVGGSETYIIEMSRNIAKITNYDTYVFCRTDQEEIFDGVKYRNIKDYIPFINQNKVHTVIISRYSEYIKVTQENDVDNIYFVIHDLLPSGNIIPLHESLKGIFCMSEWHKEYFLNIFPTLRDKTFIFPNGINVDEYQSNNFKKKKHCFIYSSFANRGLVHLLRMFPKIREKLPDATLRVFCDTKNNYVQNVAKDDMDEIEKLLVEQKEWVTNYGWVPKDILRKHWMESEIWLYPCTFSETFCITAIEAAMSKTLAISIDLAALNNTIGDRGILISGDPKTTEWQEIAITSLLEVLDDEQKMIELLEKNYKWTLGYDWKILAAKFVNDYFRHNYDLDYAGMLNWSSDIPYGSKIIFEKALDNFRNKKCRILEIGTYSGTSVINMLQYLPDATATVIDIWKDYDENKLLESIEKNRIEEIFYHNISIAGMKDRIIVKKNDSKKVLMDFIRENTNFDLIYVDGSHTYIDCYTDLTLSWELLSVGGMLIADDYIWMPADLQNELDRPYHAINHFMEKIKNQYTVFDKGYRMFLIKNK